MATKNTYRPAATPVKPEPQEKSAAVDEGNWVHCKLEFLKPEKIRDAQKRKPDHPDYDPSTLYIPPEFYSSQTPVSYYQFYCQLILNDLSLTSCPSWFHKWVFKEGS